jgi:hypothetical protein
VREADSGASFPRGGLKSARRSKTPPLLLRNPVACTDGLMSRWYQHKSLLAVLGGVVAFGLAFAASRLGHRVVPHDPSPSQALDRNDAEACDPVSDYGEPLVVDWASHQRAKVEVAMRHGVPVVAYDCKSLRLLGGCLVEGSYAFVPVSRKEEVVQLEDKDELRANLPAFGGVLASKLDAELSRGMTLDVAMVLVGQKRTTLEHVERKALRGGPACEGATHFVRGAFMGAFAMGLGTSGKASSAASVFSGNGQSSKVSRYRDGQPDTCAQAHEGAVSPPDTCAALVRLELVALDQPAEQETPSIASGAAEFLYPDASPSISAEGVKTVEVERVGCPEGLMLSQGKCTRQTPGKPHLCHVGNRDDCAAQCAAGSAGSCNNLANVYLNGTGVEKDSVRAASLFKQACDGNSAVGCSNLGHMYLSDKVVKRDAEKADSLFKRACDGGYAGGCESLGWAYVTGDGVERDFARAVALSKQACEGASGSCGGLGNAYLNGWGVEKDVARAAALFKRTCDSGSACGCWKLGFEYVKGWGVERDVVHAAALYKQACDGGCNSACPPPKGVGFSPY